MQESFENLSNEELAIRIQAGERDLIPYLWERVSRFAKHKSNFYIENKQRSGKNFSFEYADLVQEAYFALLSAIDAYHPDIEANFLTIFKYKLKWTFSQVFGSKVPASMKHDAFNDSISGDEPLFDDSGETLFNAIKGHDDAETEAIQRVYLNQLRKALDKGLAKLTSRREEVLRARYYEELSTLETAKKLNVSRGTVNSTESSALREMYLMHDIGLERYLDEAVNWYSGTGLSRFKEKSESSVESIVLKREKLVSQWLREQKRPKRAKLVKSKGGKQS